MEANSTIKNGKRNNTRRLVVLAMALFVFFSIAGLYFNYLLSWRIEQQAVAINLAGRQRMLSQRMVKVLLQIDNARRSGEPSAKAYLEELKLSFDLFDNTLRGFDAGHETRGGAGEKLFLSPVTEIKARKTVSEAVAIWKDYRGKVLALLESGEKIEEASLQSALVEAQARNLNLLALMNTLTTTLESQTQHEAERIRVFQAATLLLALSCFIWLFVLFRRLDREAVCAKEKAEEATRRIESESANKAFLLKLSADLHQSATLSDFSKKFMQQIAPLIEADYGAFYMFDENSQLLTPIGGYAVLVSELETVGIGYGLVGQCAKTKAPILINDSTDTPIRIACGAGGKKPKSIVIMPVAQADCLCGVIVLAMLKPMDAEKQALLDALMPMVAMNIERLSDIRQE
jgi:putative methionine-R-sulfoxide reductase with GAF domain